MNPPTTRRTVTCPGCGGPSLYAAENPWRPFCSERCKNHDFGAWATERYRVAAQPEIDEDDGDLPPAPTH
ncbi:MAG: DNA gyrase inhibitor YacG [Piscinibacter sp.]|nr:DNA gyrase inhibitor YacG [Piscinibacter sp.]